VLVDDHRLAVGAERPVDFVAGEAGGVVGNGDLLIGQGVADDDQVAAPPMMRIAPITIDRVEAVLLIGVLPSMACSRTTTLGR
jgi:hypothetical protein